MAREPKRGDRRARAEHERGWFPVVYLSDGRPSWSWVSEGDSKADALKRAHTMAKGEAARYAELLPGHRLVVEQRWEEAAQFYQRMLQQHPGDWQVRYRLGWLAFARGRLEQAEAAFSRILRGKSREMPDWVRAGSLLYLARVHDQQGEREQAVKLYEKIVDDYGDLSAHQSARLGLVTPYRRVKLDAR